MIKKNDSPSNAEVEQWRQLALDSEVTLEELTTIAVRKYVADIRRHIKGTIQDFLKTSSDKATPAKALNTCRTSPVPKIIQEKAEYAYNVYCFLVSEVNTLLEGGVEICSSCEQLVIEGNEIIATLEEGVPDLITVALSVIELHEIAIELEYHLTHDLYEEDQLANDDLDGLRSQLEGVLGVEYNPEGRGDS